MPEALLRTTASALLAICPVLAACASGSASSAQRPTSPSAVTAVSSVPADEPYARQLADSLRGALLARAGWGVEGDSCDPGALRAFPADTTSERRALTAALIERLETMIVSYGLDAPLDAPPARDLVRTLVGWEAGGARPLWDVAAGERADRRAIAPGLGGRYRLDGGAKCQSYVSADSVTIALPAAAARIDAPRIKGVRLALLAGDSAFRRARTALFARDSSLNATFEYAHVAPLVVWGDYAMATVRRLGELRSGALTTGKNAGNASYLFHRAGGEWRLLAIARTW